MVSVTNSGISAVARACSDYIDNLCGGVIRQWLIENIGKMEGYLLSEHPDFLAFIVIVLYVVFMSIGVQVRVLSSFHNCDYDVRWHCGHSSLPIRSRLNWAKKRPKIKKTSSGHPRSFLDCTFPYSSFGPVWNTAHSN